MPVTVVRCPQCNAIVEGYGNTPTLRCKYCDAALQGPSPPTIHRHPPPVSVDGAGTPRRTWWIALGLVGMLVALGTLASVLVRRGTARVHWQWLTHPHPVFIDVDGDNVPDPVGLLLRGEAAGLAAFSGKTGLRLWERDMGPYQQLERIAATSNLVLVSSKRGTLTAHERTGTVRWSLELGERIDEFCAGATPTEIAIRTSDDRWWEIDEHGKQRVGSPRLLLDRDRERARTAFLRDDAETAPETCFWIAPQAYRATHGVLTLQRNDDLVVIPNMSVARYMRRGPGPIIAVGHKSPGTSVGMVAAIDGNRVLWTAEIPAVEPLVSDTDVEDVTMSEGAVFAYYDREKPANPRLTAIDRATGKRLWDVELARGDASDAATLSVVGSTLYIIASRLRAHDAADGKQLFTIGNY